MLYLLKFFALSIIRPEKKVKRNLMLKRANEQAHKKAKKKKAKKAKKAEKKAAKEEAADIEELDENHTWDEVEVEAEKNTSEEVIRI